MFRIRYLMHGERGSLIGWFHVGFRVMQKNVSASGDLLDGVQQPVVQQHLGENSRVILKTVNRQHLQMQSGVQASLCTSQESQSTEVASDWLRSFQSPRQVASKSASFFRSNSWLYSAEHSSSSHDENTESSTT